MTHLQLDHVALSAQKLGVSNSTDHQTQKDEREAQRGYIRKLLSGEIKPSSSPVRFLSIAEQKALGIPTDSTTTTVTLPKNFKK